ncbi:MAG: aminotransferase class I/II-fold pyridoxal phosphate-dependent enzyme, partial [Melioribacteraceae bacterium]
HYSNNYAAKLSGKPIHQFAHLEFTDLEAKIKSVLLKNQKPLIITDGVFPIFGRIAPVKEYLSIAVKYNGIVWIDDAHGLGVIGENGRGTVEHSGITSERVFFGGTFSKAFGGFGGVIPGRKAFIDEIRNDQIQNGATPVPSAAAAASLTGMKILKSNTEMRTKLWLNANRLKSGLAQIGIKTDNTSVPITAWKMKSVSEMQKIQSELKKKDIIIQLINYIGAGDGGALRTVVFSTHSNEQIDNLIYELKRIL